MRDFQCLVPKEAWYSFIDPMKAWKKAESTLPSPRIEFRTSGVEAQHATQTKLGCINDPIIRQKSSEGKHPSSPTPKKEKNYEIGCLGAASLSRGWWKREEERWEATDNT
ncbi:hypothetical protein TNCV_2743851 [Trichonephila clavipes]|nr:hypothetical protein TNCV_2743851 [Trichonephila clavipes]